MKIRDLTKKPAFIRVTVIALIFLVALVWLLYNLIKIQFYKDDYYRDKALDQYTQERTINPKRGTIYDRNMEGLAISASVENVCISPFKIKTASENKEELIADYLAETLGVERENLITRMQNEKNQYYLVKKQVERDITDKIRQWMSENDLSEEIFFEDNTKRYYPYGNLASHVLGFTQYDNSGIYGIEAQYDSYLKGNPGKVITAKDGVGNDMPFKYEKYIGAENGTNVVLTLDKNIQGFLEKALDSALADTRANNRVMGIVMDVNTAEILAMSVKPDYDPNTPLELDAISQAKYDAFTGTDEEKEELLIQLRSALWKNKAVTERYEPGSTFKLITSAMALEENKVSETDTFFCSGAIHVDGYPQPIHCHLLSGHKSETFEQALQNSCNPVFVQLAQRVGKTVFYKYFEDFGFMDKTGIDLPNEADSIYHSDLSQFNNVELSVYSFGQTFKITPIQLLTPVSAVANGGKLMKPHIVKELVDDSGNIIESYEPEIVRQVVSDNTSETIMRYLANGINVGSTKNAYVKGYAVAAKTGTSQKREEQLKNPNANNLYIGSCVAFAPADDPQVAVLVLIDEPCNGQIYGGVIAAPVVSKVLTDVLPYLNIAPELSEAEKQTMEIAVPDCRNTSVTSAIEKLKESGLSAKVIGNGDYVSEQFPRNGKITGGGIVILYTAGESPAETATVPYVLGYTANEANKVIINSNLNIKLEGTYISGADGTAARAVSQDPAYGTKVQPGSVVTVTFKHLDGTD